MRSQDPFGLRPRSAGCRPRTGLHGVEAMLDRLATHALGLGVCIKAHLVCIEENIPKEMLPHVRSMSGGAFWNAPYGLWGLIISRALVEIFNDDYLKKELRFRGGTALNKLHFPTAYQALGRPSPSDSMAPAFLASRFALSFSPDVSQ